MSRICEEQSKPDVPGIEECRDVGGYHRRQEERLRPHDGTDCYTPLSKLLDSEPDLSGDDCQTIHATKVLGAYLANDSFGKSMTALPSVRTISSGLRSNRATKGAMHICGRY